MPSLLLHLQLVTSIISEHRARNNNHYWEGNTPTRSPDLCISQVTHCQRRSRVRLHCLVRSPTSSLPADSPAGESLTNHCRMLQDTKCVYRKIRRKQKSPGADVCVFGQMSEALPKQWTFPETEAMNWVKRRSVRGRSTRDTSSS